MTASASSTVRPWTIVWFERVYFIVLAQSLLEALFAPWNRGASGAPAWQAPLILTAGTLLILLIWYFAARRASNIARWIAILMSAAAIFTVKKLVLPDVSGLEKLSVAFSLIANGALVVLLLLPASGAWFRKAI